VTEIVAERVQFGPKAGGATGGRSFGNNAAEAAPEKAAVEEIPTINIDDEIKAEDLPK
jgi:hypothetical protein